MKNNPLRVYELNPMSFGDVTGCITAHIMADVRDMLDKTIVDAVVRTAQEAGITTLYLLDKQFILDAIREKMDRERETE